MVAMLFASFSQPIHSQDLVLLRTLLRQNEKKYNKKQLNKFCNRKLGFRGYLRIIEWRFGYVKRKWSEEQVE